MKERIKWLDILKGFLIITVMIGHSGVCPVGFRAWIYSFHVPAFFIVSGYTFQIREEKSFVRYVVKKARTLLVPAMVFGMISCVYYYFFVSKSIFLEQNFLYNLALQSRVAVYPVSWFCISLFVSEIVLFVIFKLCKKEHIRFLMIMILSLASYCYVDSISKILPWCIDVLGITLLFLYIGYVMRIKNILAKLNTYKYVSIIILLVINIIFANMNYQYLNMQVDLYYNLVGNYVYYYIASIAGTLIFMMIFYQKRKIITLEYIGVNSMVYYTLHSVLYETIWIYIMENKIIVNFYYCPLFIIIILIVLFPITYIINHFFPFVLGKKKEKVNYEK